MAFIVTNFLGTVGAIGYSGLGKIGETIGVVPSGPSQQNINNKIMYKKLRIGSMKAAKREENYIKRQEIREQQNKLKEIEAEKEAKEQKIEIAKTFSPGLKNTELKNFINKHKEVIDIAIELNNFLDNILSNNKISTKCFQIDKKLVNNLAAVLNKNNIILLKKIEYFEEAYKIVTNKIRIPGQFVGTRSFINNNINSKNYEKLIKKESIALQICMQIAIKYGVNEKIIRFERTC